MVKQITSIAIESDVNVEIYLDDAKKALCASLLVFPRSSHNAASVESVLVWNVALGTRYLNVRGPDNKVMCQTSCSIPAAQRRR